MGGKPPWDWVAGLTGPVWRCSRRPAAVGLRLLSCTPGVITGNAKGENRGMSVGFTWGFVAAGSVLSPVTASVARFYSCSDGECFLRMSARSGRNTWSHFLGLFDLLLLCFLWSLCRIRSIKTGESRAFSLLSCEFVCSQKCSGRGHTTPVASARSGVISFLSESITHTHTHTQRERERERERTLLGGCLRSPEQSRNTF